MSYYRTQLENWLKTLDVKADRVLDIGGAQGLVKGRTQSWDVKEYHIADIEEPFDIELEMNLLVYYSVPPEIRRSNAYDLIFCLEVFDYIWNPVAAFNNISLFLKKGGKAYASFPFVYPHHNELEREGLRYTEISIRRLAENSGLKVNQIIYRIDRSGHLENFYHADGMHPAKGYNHHNATGFIAEFTR